MSEMLKETMVRTEKILCNHLNDLGDEVERNGGRIGKHMVLDGIKDAVKALKDIHKIMSMGDSADAAKQPSAATASAK